MISKSLLREYTAIQHPPKDNTTIIYQYPGKILESLGLLKMDFLGLRNLSIIDNVINIIKERHNTIINIDEIDIKDQKVFKIFQDGNTKGVFQFESPGMQRYLKELIPNTLEDIIAMNALYRPGPMEFIPDFIKRKHGEVLIEYVHESLSEILEPTYGIAVYQEQILQIAQIFAGYSLGQADILRRAIGKKIPEEMQRQRKCFIEKATELKRELKTSKYIFDDIIVPFACYGFNKLHSAAYSLIAYQTAFLKAYYPTEFMAGLINSEKGNLDKITEELKACKKMNITIMKPSINTSLYDFAVKDENTILFGLSTIKNLSDSLVEDLIESRKKDSEFKSLEDFATRLDKTHINKKNIEALALSGALDDFNNRHTLFENTQGIINHAKFHHDQESSGQMELFSMDENENKINIQEKKEYDCMTRLKHEKEYLGFFISQHPLAGLDYYWKKYYDDISNLNSKKIEKEKKVAGLITGLRILVTKKGDKMAVFTLETIYGDIAAVIFPKAFEEYGNRMNDNELVVVNGKIKAEENRVQILANSVKKITRERIEEKAAKEGILTKNTQIENKGMIKVEIIAEPQTWSINIPRHCKEESLKQLKKLFEQNKGIDIVTLIFPDKQQLTIPNKVKLTKLLRQHAVQVLALKGGTESSLDESNNA